MRFAPLLPVCLLVFALACEPEAATTPTPRVTPTPAYEFLTPTPTVMPRPTSTPRPVGKCETSEARAYLTRQEPPTNQLARGMGDVGDLFTLAGLDVTLLWDLDWQLQTAAVLVDVDAAADKILAISAPQIFRAADRDLKEAARLLKEFVDLAVKGIDEFDATILVRANNSLLKANDFVLSAADKLKRACR